MPQINHFKRWISRDTTPRRWGTWLMSTAAATAEALGHGGFDFLVVDLEHVPVDANETIHILRAIGNTSAQAVVRLAWNDAVLAKRALDSGAQTLLFPFVESAAQAALAVSSALYAPAGTRGVAAVHRASQYGADTQYLAQANTEICVIVQIESPTAIAAFEEIASTPGVDAIFVGPGDLAASLGHIGQMNAEPVQTALRELAARSHALGKPCGTVAPTPELAARYVEYGYDFIAVASDIGFMMRKAGEVLAQVRS
jgi:4-hydroxy-2-oxoheptanedioate aldolase